MEPKISVIIPVYNKEAYLAECLDSVLGQTLRDIEVVVVDDGSTDSSKSVVERYMHDDGRVRLVSQENMGVAAARNKGMEEACGEFISFCDPDDFLSSPDALEKLYKGATDHGLTVCGGSLCEVDEETGEIRSSFDEIHAAQVFAESHVMSYEEYQFDYGFYRFIYSRSLISENGIRFPGYVRFQDPPFMVEALIAAGSFYAISDCVYSYRVGHNEVNWNEEKACALVRGLSDVIRMSRDRSLPKLHSLAVRRLEEEYEFVFDIQKESMAVMAELVRCNSFIVPDMLDGRQKEEGLIAPDAYLVAPLRLKLAYLERLKDEISSMQRAIDETNKDCARRIDEVLDVVAAREEALCFVESSASFKVGRVVTALPRRLRDAVRR